MNEQNKSKVVEAAQSNEGASAVGSTSAWRRLMGKKWAFPALYMVAAAIILTLMWAYQDSTKHAATSSTKVESEVAKTGTDATTGTTGDALPVAAATETLRWPVKDRAEVEVQLPFYDSKASNDVKQAAMVEYGDTFTPHVGIDLARGDNQTFDVLASASGKVTAVETNPLAGNLVEITMANGMVTVYQSLTDIKVAKGADVKKGDVIAKAGRSELEKDQGVHLHFEVRQTQGGPAVSPETVITDH
jgi:stage II sporulation protein Q